MISWLTKRITTYKYGADGYTDFTKPMDEYDLNRARVKIYGTLKPKPIQAVIPPATLSSRVIQELAFPSLAVVERMLTKLPDETIKILVVTPFHIFAQPVPGSENEIHWLYPFDKVYKRITNGRKDSLAFYFSVFIPELFS